MTWRRLGLVLAGLAWVSGCGDTTSGGPGGTISPGPGGPGGTAGTAGAGGSVGGQGGQGATAGKAGNGAAAGVAGNGATAGAAGNGASAGVAGNGAAAGNPPNTCSVPVAAGQGCPTEGATCDDACGNACKCSDGQWFCNGQCTVPPGQCAPGAKCTPGDACGEAQPDGCSLACNCTKGGFFTCDTVCPPPSDCSPGSKCQPGQSCEGTDENGCQEFCSCNAKGFNECKTDCSNACPVESAVCGAGCGQLGQSCTCFGKDGGVPCSCLPGPTDAPVWDCSMTPPTGCQDGAACKPGEGCGTGSDPNGCSTSCSCGKGGTFVCTTSCASTCPDKPPTCGDSCKGSPSAECKCFGGEIGFVPCSCQASPEGLTWECSTPTDTCTPGAFCSPGAGCQEKQDDGCVLSCSCSAGGLYQCKSVCPSDPDGCPATEPKPGSMCATPGLSCAYGVFETCACSKAGTWDCAL